MYNISFDKTSIKINGKDSFLVSGEFPYFRIPRTDWKRRMELFRDAGGNCIATYVPWVIHEVDEGRIFFDDVDHRSLTAFLETAREVGLGVILRPGPYQYSELLGAGLPLWLLEKYPQIRAVKLDGSPLNYHSVSYLHPLFLEKARRYYRAFAEVVRQFLGNPVIMLQADNECTGVHVWYGSVDYHPVTMGFGREDGRYARFLQKKYGTVEALNEAYRLGVTSFAEVMPIESDRRDGVICRRMQDYLDFYCETVSEYIALLCEWMREDGLDLPFCHNASGHSRATMFRETAKRMHNENFMLGIDAYYALHQGTGQNNPTNEYALKILTGFEFLRMMDMPPVVLEMQSGALADIPRMLPEDMSAMYHMCIALGMKGVNYYVITGGPNVEGTGETCDIYDYNAPISADGTMKDTFEAIREANIFMRNHAWLQQSRRRTSVAIGYEWSTHRAGGVDRKGQMLGRADCWTFLRNTVLYGAMCSAYAPEMVALDHSLDLSMPLIVPCPSNMSADAQQKLINFVEAGGRLLIMGDLPSTNESFEPCDLLRKYLGTPSLRIPNQRLLSVECPEVGNIYTLDHLYLLDEAPKGAELIMQEKLSGAYAGFSGRYGKGRVIYLGFTFELRYLSQIRMLERLLEQLCATPAVRSSNASIFTSLLEDDRGNAMLAAMNLHSGAQSTTLTVYGRDGSKERKIDLSLPPMKVEWIKL